MSERVDLAAIRAEIEPYTRKSDRPLWAEEILSDRHYLANMARRHLLPLCDAYETLAAENTTLRESLLGEWLSNHYRNCTRWDGIGDCPNVLGCQWPKPAALAEHPQAAPAPAERER